MNKEDKFLAWAGWMQQLGPWGLSYDNDEVIDFEKHYDENLTDKENEERFQKWVHNDYSL